MKQHREQRLRDAEDTPEQMPHWARGPDDISREESPEKSGRFIPRSRRVDMARAWQLQLGNAVVMPEHRDDVVAPEQIDQNKLRKAVSLAMSFRKPLLKHLPHYPVTIKYIRGRLAK